MAKYLILIYGDSQAWAEMSEPERQRLDAGHAAFVAKAGAAVLDGGELYPPGTATTLRAGSGNTDGSSSSGPTVTDGPFLETKEGIGGYYLLEAADLDEALSLAGQLPEVAAAHSGVEVRPIRGRD